MVSEGHLNHNSKLGSCGCDIRRKCYVVWRCCQCYAITVGTGTEASWATAHARVQLSQGVYYFSESPLIKRYVYDGTMGFCPVKEQGCQIKCFQEGKFFVAQRKFVR
jgi:hypothetical protein